MVTTEHSLVYSNEGLGTANGAEDLQVIVCKVTSRCIERERQSRSQRWKGACSSPNINLKMFPMVPPPVKPVRLHQGN